jgi:hypothetical protein
MEILSRIMSFVLVVLVLLGLTACDNANGFFGSTKKSPVGVSLENEPDQALSYALKRPMYSHYVLAKALVDNITINGIIVNRGNCIPLSSAKFPATIRFGEKRGLDIGQQCDVSEVTVSTNQGDWTFNFDK